jgi:hypothetical protein
MANVAVSIDRVEAVQDCDSGDNPGDFHARVTFVDENNQTLAAAVEAPLGTYGVDGSFGNTFHINDGESHPLDETTTFQLPRVEGAGFAVGLSGIEWDSATLRDPRMDDHTGHRTHIYSGGRFEDIIGPRIVNVGASGCSMRLHYTVTVS